MRAVAKAARTNTPAVYRRFNDREDLIRGLLLWSVARLRTHFQQGDRLDAMAEAYLEFALDRPNEYQLFYSYDRLLNPKKRGKTRAPIRESRPNFAFTEEAAAKTGGKPQDSTAVVLHLWSLLHGTAMLLLSKSLPEGHQGALRGACRAAVKALIANAKR